MPRYSPGICPSGNPYAPPSALSTGSRTRQCGSSSIFIPPTAADGGPTRRTGSYSSFTNTRQRCLRTGADTAIPRQAATGIKPSNWIWWHRSGATGRTAGGRSQMAAALCPGPRHHPPGSAEPVALLRALRPLPDRSVRGPLLKHHHNSRSVTATARSAGGSLVESPL